MDFKTRMKKNESLNFILKHKIIAVLRRVPERDILSLARALLDGGIKIIEVTFTNKDAARLIKILKSGIGKDVLVGAGTVKEKLQLVSSYKAGADFFVSPYFDKTLVSFAKKFHVLYIPGCATPTEVACAVKAGCKVIKIFPSSSFGHGHVKALKTVFPDILFMPTGGIAPKDVKQYFDSGASCIGAGSELVRAQWLMEKNFTRVKNNALKYSRAAGVLSDA